MNNENKESQKQQTKEQSKFITEVMDFAKKIGNDYESNTDDGLDPEGDSSEEFNFVLFGGHRQDGQIVSLSTGFGDMEAIALMAYNFMRGNLELTEAFLSAAQKSYSEFN